MNEVSTFFRHCPSCGKRFEIRLVDKKLVDDRKTTENVEQASVAPGGLIGAGGIGGAYMGSGFVYVEENVPITIEVQDFKYTYKCKHCGHMWAEVREQENRA